MCRTSWAMLSSPHNSIHYPEMEINPPKTACSCRCSGVIRNGLTRDHLTLMQCICHCTIAYTVWSPVCSSVELSANNSFKTPHTLIWSASGASFVNDTNAVERLTLELLSQTQNCYCCCCQHRNSFCVPRTLKPFSYKTMCWWVIRQRTVKRTAPRGSSHAFD